MFNMNEFTGSTRRHSVDTANIWGWDAIDVPSADIHRHSQSQLLSDGNLIVQVEGKMRLVLACILITGRSTLSVYQFGGGIGGGVSGHIMFRQMFLTRKIELCAPRPADKKTVSCGHLAFPCSWINAHDAVGQPSNATCQLWIVTMASKNGSAYRKSW